jgi:hypothetical protein
MNAEILAIFFEDRNNFPDVARPRVTPWVALGAWYKISQGHAIVKRQAVVHRDERLLVAEAFGLHKVAQQILEAVHAIEEAEIRTLWKEPLDVIVPEEAI